MRIAVLMIAIVLIGCSKKSSITISEDHWWGSTTRRFSSQEEVDKYIEQERQETLDVAKALPFDYVACSEQVLARELREGQHSVEDRAYLSIFDVDPNEVAMIAFKRQHANSFPRSALPSPEDGSLSLPPGWQYNVYAMKSRRFGRAYEAFVSYYCGVLCAGQYRYRIEKDGNTCKVISREQFGPVS